MSDHLPPLNELFTGIKPSKHKPRIWLNTQQGLIEVKTMDNQHKKITGYRDLTQEEIDLMNEIKELGNQCGGLIEKLRAGHPEWDPDQRWLSIGQTHLQQGFMALTRSIAKPESF